MNLRATPANAGSKRSVISEKETTITIEQALTRVVAKPWGSRNLQPWSDVRDGEEPIGELWFERSALNAPEPALLLKLLFTEAALSIQVHPDDEFARSIGLDHGKSEAWYVLSATADAKIALGLKTQISAFQLRSSIVDGSISDLIQWQGVVKDDIIAIPAGTIHTMGPGLVIAEIQQRIDVTFRLFDYGRKRELQIDNAVEAAFAGPAAIQQQPATLVRVRTQLTANPHFVLDRINLAPEASWELNAEHETWLLVIDGHARIELFNLFAGEAMFMESHRASIKAGPDGLVCLIAYADSQPATNLPYRVHEDHAGSHAKQVLEATAGYRLNSALPAGQA